MNKTGKKAAPKIKPKAMARTSKDVSPSKPVKKTSAGTGKKVKAASRKPAIKAETSATAGRSIKPDMKSNASTRLKKVITSKKLDKATKASAATISKSPARKTQPSPRKPAASAAKAPKTTAKKLEPSAVSMASTRLKAPVKRPLKAVPRHLASRLPVNSARKLSAQLTPAQELTRKAYARPGKIYVKRPGKIVLVTDRPGTKRTRPLSPVSTAFSPLFADAGDRGTPASPMKAGMKRPLFQAILPEPGEELLSIAEIEAKEGYVAMRKLKMFLPRDEGSTEAAGHIQTHEPEELPPAYGKNALLMIAVDPGLLFVDWEIRSEALPAGDPPLVLRIYDVTGNKFNRAHARGFIDVGLGSRSGSGYLELELQGREILGEIGPAGPGGRLTAIIRSERLTLPPLLRYDEFGIVRKLQEAGIPVGY